MRIDDDLTIRVSDLALLKSPQTHEPLESQLGRLLSNDERQRYGRLMGSHASIEAADSVEPQPQPRSIKKSAGAEHRSMVDPFAAAAPAAAAPAAAAPPPPPTAEPAAKRGLSGLSSDQGVGGGLWKDTEAGTERWWRLDPTDALPRLQPGSPPPAVMGLVRRPELRTCVETAAHSAALPPGHLPRVMLQIRNGHLVKLRLEGGLPLDTSCPQPPSASVGSLPDGWLLLEVPR